MTTLTAVLSIIITIGLAFVTTWINIKVKFAKDAAHAIQEARQIVLRVAMWASNCVLFALLVGNLASPGVHSTGFDFR